MADDSSARLYQAFVSHDSSAAIRVIERAKQRGVAQADLFDTIFAPAMAQLGGAWASGAIDEYAFTQAAVVAEQVTSFVTPPVSATDTGVTVLVGTMHHDLHSIEKDMTAAALRQAGHRVVDLGTDVRPSDFLERAEETGARIVVVFAQTMSTARSAVRVREMFASAARDDVAIFVGGGPFVADVSLAKDVGANGVSRGSESALRLIAKVAERMAARS